MAVARRGTNLFGIYGQRAGVYPGFAYSPGFSTGSKNIVWDQAALDRWLADPQAVMPGTTVLYKQASPERRTAVINFLMSVK